MWQGPAELHAHDVPLVRLPEGDHQVTHTSSGNEETTMTTMTSQRKPQGGVYAYLIDRGRVWVESINSVTGTALVWFDPNLGRRSRQHKVNLSQIDFNREWRF